MYIRIAFSVLAGLLWVAGGVYAQDSGQKGERSDSKIARLLEKVDSSLYSPASEVRDLRFRLVVPILDQMMPDADIQFLWRAGTKRAKSKSLLKLDSLDSPMKPSIQAQVKQQAGRLASAIVRTPLSQELRGSSVELARDGDAYKLTILPGSSADANWSSRFLWIGPDFLPRRAETEVKHPDHGTFTEVTTYEWALFGNSKRRVLASLEAVSPVGEHSVFFEYADVKGVTLAHRIRVESKINPTGPIVVEFADLQINTDIKDEEFE